MMKYETCIQHQVKRKGKQGRKSSKHVVQIHEKKLKTALGRGIIYDRGSKTSVNISFNSLGAILSGPGALLSLKHKIILSISAVDAGAQNMLLLLAT